MFCRATESGEVDDILVSELLRRPRLGLGCAFFAIGFMLIGAVVIAWAEELSGEMGLAST
jgi:hypothetical protein